MALAGGLVGLGGAELRLPYLTGTLRLPLKKAIPVNLAVSLATLLAALPTRLYTLKRASLKPFLFETAALALGSTVGAYAGVAWLRRLSLLALKRAVFALLLALGLVMIAKSVMAVRPSGVLPEAVPARIVSALALGFAIGAVSGLLGVAGGEVIIPTLILGFGAPIKAAGSLSQTDWICETLPCLVFERSRDSHAVDCAHGLGGHRGRCRRRIAFVFRAFRCTESDARCDPDRVFD